MKAAYITQTGGPDVIHYGDLPDPVIGPHQVLIRTEAVSVNPIDTYIRAGMVKFPLPSPFVIGCDVAGTVERIGDDVVRWRVGDRVWATAQGVLGRQGTFAELCAVDAQFINPIPDGIAPTAAAACALVGVTACLGLVRDAKLKSGEILLVRGGAGGVGSMVVQIGKAIAANVIATAGSPEKAKLCRQLGADFVIEYREEDLRRRVKELAPEGVDVFWETVREPDFDMAVDLLAPRGRMVLMAGRDARPPFPVGPFYVKGCTLVGFAMFNATPDELREAAEDVNEWLETGKLKPLVARTLPLSQAAHAHQLQEETTLRCEGNLAGKIVLTVP
jgi:NADPH2:quinone reductase